MEKKFNIIVVVSILVLLFTAVVGQHYFDRMEAPILAMKQMNLKGVIAQNIYILNKSYSISFWIITSSQIISISILLGVLYNNNKQSKLLETHEDKIKEAEASFEKQQKDLDEAYKKLERTTKLTERNSRFLEFIQKADTLDKLTLNLINEIAKELNATQAAFFIAKTNEEKMKLVASYAYHLPKTTEVEFELGEGLIGQVAMDGAILNLKEIPEGHLEIISGLGSSQKANLILVPIKSDEKVIGIIELASFEEIDNDDVEFINSIGKNAAAKLSVFIN